MPTAPLLLGTYFGGVGLTPRGVARDLGEGPYPLREGLPLRLWEMDPLEDGSPDYLVEDAVAHYDEARYQWTWCSVAGTFTRRSEAPSDHWVHTVNWPAEEARSARDRAAWLASWRAVRPGLPESPLRCRREEPARGENLHLGGGRFRDTYCPEAEPNGGYSNFVWDAPGMPPRPNVACPWCGALFLRGYHDLHPDERPEGHRLYREATDFLHRPFDPTRVGEFQGIVHRVTRLEPGTPAAAQRGPSLARLFGILLGAPRVLPTELDPREPAVWSPWLGATQEEAGVWLRAFLTYEPSWEPRLLAWVDRMTASP